MGALRDRLVTTTTLLSDGAWGTMLQQAGLAAGSCPEAWNVEPEGQRGPTTLSVLLITEQPG
ncbi:MAG: hypothetical protein ACOCXA_08785, partial [Planctomycetota bacterium]